MTWAFCSPPTLARKVITVIGMTTLAATLTLIPAIFVTVRQGMQGQRQRHLSGVQHLVAQLIEENRQKIKNYAVLFATDRQIKDNLYYYAELAGEREHPANAVHHLVAAFGLEHIELGDRYGRVVVNSTNPSLEDRELGDEPLVSQALSGGTAIGIEQDHSGFVLKAVAPIFHDEGQLIGTLSTGMALNNAFATMIKGLSGAEILISDDGGRVVASSHPGLVQGTKINPLATAMTFDGKTYQVMNQPFLDARQHPLGQVVIMAEDLLPVILRQATVTMIAILVGIALISIVATALVLRRVLAPIRELRIGAEQIGCGHFEHRLPVTTGDEIGSLAQSFNAMAANLQQMREVEERLKQAERLASIGEFTAATAHELNNPIANIIGLAKVIRRDTADGTPLAEDLDLLAKEASRCGAIVRDLLIYSRPLAPNHELVDLNLLLEGSIRAMQGRHQGGQDITFHFDRLPDDQAQAFVDPAQMEQVFRNLLLNGVQAIGASGRIRVRAEKSGPARLTLEFADTGCGIRPEHLDKVFYPFFTTKKTGEGTGLGLAVCYAIVKGHGGELTVTSQAGEGSIFTLTLPIGEHHG